VPSDARPGLTFGIRALVAWLVAACLALGGVAPTVSTALAAAATADLCIGAGSGGARDGAPADGRVHGADCAYCLPHGGTDATPPPGLARLPALAVGLRREGPVAVAPVSPARTWSPSAARAPPPRRA